jgi:murein DD-endopeptidase MepM/ murein hydrolase activator NlpD
MLWPVKGRITQVFGRPALQVEPTMYLQKDVQGWKRCKPTAFNGGVKFDDVHPGVDVACPIGTPVRAPETGRVAQTVTYRVFNPLVGRYVLGRYVMFRFGDLVLYADHLDKFVAPEGATVIRGATIARTGNSGISTGPHVHFEIRKLAAGETAQSSWASFRLNPERFRED